MDKTPEVAQAVIPDSELDSGMLTGLLEVPVGGFRWRDDVRPALEEGSSLGGLIEDDPPEGERWLVPVSGAVVKRYSVMNKPSLARDFVRLTVDSTDAASRDFANRYGWLGNQQVLTPRGQGPLRSISVGGDPTQFGESRTFWTMELLEFRDIWDVWQDSIILADAGATRGQQQAARERLAARFYWHPDGSVRYDSRGEIPTWGWRSWHEWISHPQMRDFDTLQRRLPAGNHASAASYFVHRRINQRLRGHVNPHILPFRSSVLRFAPDSLLTAIYLRLALEVSGGLGRMRECQGCGREFSPARRDQVYCNKNCRERAHYRRQAGLPQSERGVR